ncbi:MAG TPA: UDP-N-acetylmuramoyl-tripeptide--D-alanyl-D-alanine ligase [Pseudomonadales bacterium]|nr:UDP-N-acetylmuramoyl-tripeptide--D-alanyl-D-alanine ligase [Pseudomonadales bacterium]
MIRAFSLQEIAAACDCVAPPVDALVHGICIDSRKIKSGDLFVAIRGERFDAHDYLADVQKAGAVAAIVERTQPDITLPQLQVPDAILALGLVARLNRDLFQGPLVALTGSAGKTTTKEMIAAILQEVGTPLVTQGNLNNHIGVPLTLLNLVPENTHAVIEMGASALGEIDYLARMAKPDVALITNVAPAHIEGFGSIDNVARGKAEIFSQLSATGTAIINLDNVYTASMREALAGKCNAITCSMQAVADVYATGITQTPAGMAFVLHADNATEKIQLRFIGEHNVGNAVAAAACALALGIKLQDVASGLQRALPYKGRLQIKQGLHNCLVIDDTYNANPASVQMAIHALLAMPGEHCLVLGDMGELGPEAATMHHHIGVYAQQAGIKYLLATGPLSQSTVQGFGGHARHFPDWESLAGACLALANTQSVFLVKGSRSAGMERVVDVLVTGKQAVENDVLEKKAC